MTFQEIYKHIEIKYIQFYIHIYVTFYKGRSILLQGILCIDYNHICTHKED